MAVFDLGLTYGVVADDATDNTAGIQAAIDAAYAAFGGTILFPRGISQQATGINKSFTDHQGALILQGSGGDSAVRFVGANDIRYYLVNNVKTALQDMTFLGRLDATNEVTESLIYIGSQEQFNIDRCIFYGLGLGSGSTSGFVYSSAMVSVKDTQFLGCNGGVQGVVTLNGFYSGTFKNVSFFDYGTHGAQYFSKGGGSGAAWIKAVAPAAQVHARHQSSLTVNGAQFDEGADNPVYTDGVRFVDIRHTATNVKGTAGDHGFFFKDAYHVTLSDSWLGYSGGTNRKGVSADNVKFLELENLIFADGVNTVELIGDCEKVVIRNCWFLQGADLEGARTPIKIINTAGAHIDSDCNVSITG